MLTPRLSLVFIVPLIVVLLPDLVLRAPSQMNSAGATICYLGHPLASRRFQAGRPTYTPPMARTWADRLFCSFRPFAEPYLDRILCALRSGPISLRFRVLHQLSNLRRSTDHRNGQLAPRECIAGPTLHHHAHA